MKTLTPITAKCLMSKYIGGQWRSISPDDIKINQIDVMDENSNMRLFYVENTLVTKSTQGPARRVLIRLHEKKTPRDEYDDDIDFLAPTVLAKFNMGQIELHPEGRRQSLFIQDDMSSEILKKIDMTRKLYVVFFFVCCLVFT
ncbi:hypothetical protein HDE_07940 [Halotydeus destructor]|nr:hypothetical protein HDE_07940 [Halotydeus destructor]